MVAFEYTEKELDRALGQVKAVASDSALASPSFIESFVKTQALANRQAAELAECYRLTGADPDGDEDWRLAVRAVDEVRRLRAENDADCTKLIDNEIELDRQADDIANLTASLKATSKQLSDTMSTLSSVTEESLAKAEGKVQP